MSTGTANVLNHLFNCLLTSSRRYEPQRQCNGGDDNKQDGQDDQRDVVAAAGSGKDPVSLCVGDLIVRRRRCPRRHGCSICELLLVRLYRVSIGRRRNERLIQQRPVFAEVHEISR